MNYASVCTQIRNIIFYSAAKHNVISIKFNSSYEKILHIYVHITEHIFNDQFVALCEKQTYLYISCIHVNKRIPFIVFEKDTEAQ